MKKYLYSRDVEEYFEEGGQKYFFEDELDYREIELPEFLEENDISVEEYNNTNEKDIIKFQCVEEVLQDYIDNIVEHRCYEIMENNILDNEIVCIADLGLWNGRVSGYMMLDNDINSIFTLMSEYWDNIYIDTKRRGVFGEQHHHDGTNYLEFRVFKDNLTEEQKERFLKLIYNGELTNKQKQYYTKSLLYYM